MSDHTFFENKSCKYYPCHEGIEDFNCLFCYCPWYYHCGSKPEVDCKDCKFPHERDSYKYIIQGIHSILETGATTKNEESMFNACRCAKQITIAVLENNGEYWLGTNWCATPQKKCPRGDMPSGEGYELCKAICHQLGHAEEMALKEAGKKAKGGTLYLIGHTRVCENCQKLIKEAGVTKTIIVGDSDAGIHNCNK